MNIEENVIEEKNEINEDEGIDEADDIEQFLLCQYIEHFNTHFKLLLRRYRRFIEINNINNTDIDVITYLDMIVVQIRAMCIENERYVNNYTAQILLRKLGEDSLADRIDSMLNEPFIPETDFTIREAIKKLADKFICHYDNYDDPKSNESYFAETIEKRLRSPYNRVNIDYIMNTIIECVCKGFRVDLKNIFKPKDDNEADLLIIDNDGANLE